MQGWGLALRGAEWLQHQGLEPSGVWARGPALVFLAFLSLQVKKPAQGSGGQKIASATKTTIQRMSARRKKDKKYRKEIEKMGRKRSEKQGHSLTHRKKSGCLWSQGENSPGRARESSGTWAEHGAPAPHGRPSTGARVQLWTVSPNVDLCVTEQGGGLGTQERGSRAAPGPSYSHSPLQVGFRQRRGSHQAGG